MHTPNDNAAAGPMSRGDWLALALALGLGALRFWHGSQEAAEPGYVPDAIEYAVGAQRIATLGRYDLALDAATYPSRYPPWFALLLAPAYALAPHDLGAGIWVVFGFALLAVAASFMIGRALAGSAGACFAACAVLVHPWLADFARDIMTDIPATALGLAALAITLQIREPHQFSRPRAAAIGCLVAVAAALRPTALSFALPACALALRDFRSLSKRAFSVRCALLGGPWLVLQLCTLSYQYRTFGDALRNGYQFWCPVPYDYPELVWSLGYVETNAALLAQPKLLVPCALGVLGVAVQAPRSRWPAFALALVTLPLALFYGLYFFTQSRFWLPIVYVCLAVGAAACAARLPSRRWLIPLAWLCTTALVIHDRSHATVRPPVRSQLASALQRWLPADALIITDLDALYLEPQVLRGTERRVLPATRRVEYASKLVAWHALGPLSPAPRSATDHRAPGLRRSGAFEVFARTADESLPQIVARVNAGRATYAVLSNAPWNGALLRALAAQLHIERLPAAPALLRLRPQNQQTARTEKPSAPQARLGD